MGTPSAVKKKAAEAENLAQQILKQQKKRQDEPGVDVESLIAGSHDSNEPQGDPVPTPPDTDPPKSEKDTQDFEAKFKKASQELESLRDQHSTLLGKYNSEVPRLSKENRSLKERVSSMENEIASLQGELTAALEASPEASDDEVKALRDRLAQEFNEDLVDGVVSLAQSTVRKSLPKSGDKQYETDLKALRERIDQLDATKVDDKLDMMIPGWQNIQRTPEFQKLLGSGVPRTNNLIYNDLLVKWYEQGDVPSIVRFFNEFQNEQQQPANRTADEAPVEPDSGSGDPPPRARPSGKKQWKLSEINKINEMARQGYFKKRPEELAKLRRDYEIAASEGRVVKDV